MKTLTQLNEDFKISSTIRYKRPFFLYKLDKTDYLSNEVIEYFKDLSEKTSMPYQTLINFYLLDCVKNKKTLKFD